MHGGNLLAQQLGFKQRARVKRGVFKRVDDLCGRGYGRVCRRVRANSAVNAPQRGRQLFALGRGRERLPAAVGLEALCQQRACAIGLRDVVNNGGAAVSHWRARPVPGFKRSGSGLCAFIAVQVAAAFPAQRGFGKVDFNPRTWCNWAPVVLAQIVKRIDVTAQCFGVYAYGAQQALGHGYADFIQVNLQMIARPFQLAGANHQLVCTSRYAGAAALGHGPAAAAGAVQRNVYGAVVLRINSCTFFSKGLRVVRRENTADKGNDA